MNRLEQQMNFIKEIDGLKQVYRQCYIKDGTRKENDTEHSWHLAMMALILKEYAQEEIDLFSVITMVMIHDIVELDAGDTYAYDDKGNESKQERELAAAERIFSLLPKDQSAWIRSIWDEFETWETPEAKFAHTLDCLQPMMLNAATQGKAWKEHQVQLSQILQRNHRTSEGSQALWEFAQEEYMKPHVAQGNIINDL